MRSTQYKPGFGGYRRQTSDTNLLCAAKISEAREAKAKAKAVSGNGRPSRKKLLVKILRQMKADGRLPTALDEEFGS